jgi:ribosomal protein S18 acetylase RimI-like enzyme
LITDENVGLFVVDIGQELIGFAHAVIREAPAIPILMPRRYAVVESIGVSAEFLKQGIGRMLMDTVHEWAIVKGATTIELNVFEFNQAALGFYQRVGYKALSRKMSRALKSSE